MGASGRDARKARGRVLVFVGLGLIIVAILIAILAASLAGDDDSPSVTNPATSVTQPPPTSAPTTSTTPSDPPTTGVVPTEAPTTDNAGGPPAGSDGTDDEFPWLGIAAAITALAGLLTSLTGMLKVILNRPDR